MQQERENRALSRIILLVAVLFGYSMLEQLSCCAHARVSVAMCDKIECNLGASVMFFW